MIKLVKFQFFFPFCCSRSDDPAEAFKVRAFRNTCHLCPTRYNSASTCSTAVEEGERIGGFS